MVRITRLAAVALTVSLLAGAGCKHQRPAPPEIVEVRVLNCTPAAARVGFETSAVAAAAARAIGQASGLAVTDGGVPPGRAPGRRYSSPSRCAPKRPRTRRGTAPCARW